MARVSKYLVGYGAAFAIAGVALIGYGFAHGNVFQGEDDAYALGLAVLVTALLAIAVGAAGLLIGAIGWVIQRLRGSSSAEGRRADAMPRESAPFILGLLLGVPIGALVLTVVVGGTLGRLVVSLGGNLTDCFVAEYAFGIAVGACGTWLSLSQRSFRSGSIIGACAGNIGFLAMLSVVSRGMHS